VSGDLASVQMLFIRQGRMLGSRGFFPKTPLADDRGALLGEFISQLYLGGGGLNDLPREIIAEIPAEDAEVLSAAISQTLGRKVAVKTSVRGTRLKWLELATRSAEQSLASRLASRETVQNRSEEHTSELQSRENL